MNAATAGAVGSNTDVVPAGRLFGQAFLGGAIAAVVNVIIFFGAKAAGESLSGEFQPGQPGTLMLPAVIISSVLPALFAAIVALLVRKAKAGATIFAVIATVFLLLSMGGPFSGVAGATMTTKLVMALMHVVAGAGIGGMLFRALKR